MLYRLVSFLVKLTFGPHVNHVNVIEINFLKILFPVIILYSV